MKIQENLVKKARLSILEQVGNNGIHEDPAKPVPAIRRDVMFNRIQDDTAMTVHAMKVPAVTTDAALEITAGQRSVTGRNQYLNTRILFLLIMLTASKIHFVIHQYAVVSTILEMKKFSIKEWNHNIYIN